MLHSLPAGALSVFFFSDELSLFFSEELSLFASEELSLLPPESVDVLDSLVDLDAPPFL